MRALIFFELSPAITSVVHVATTPRSDAGSLTSTMSEAFDWAATLRALRVCEEVATYKQPPSNKYHTAVRCTEPSSFSVPKLAMKRPVRISSAPDGIVLCIGSRPPAAQMIPSRAAENPEERKQRE